MAGARQSDPLGISGKVLDQKYRVGEAIGEGGFSVVYRAEHLLWRQPVAIKLFKVIAHAPEERRRQLLDDFIQEGKLLAELSTRCAAIVQARDVGTLTGPDGVWLPYMVLEWLDGKPLSELLRDERRTGALPRTPQQVLSLLDCIAVALDVVHEAGVAHRDVKPANIFVLDARVSTSTGEAGVAPLVKLLDFGVAKAMAEHEALASSMFVTGAHGESFTPRYGAPEQFDRSFGSTGPWTDVFALALVVVEMLRGQRALEGDDYLELAASARDKQRRPTPRAHGVDVPDAVERVLERALALEAAQRYPTAGAFWTDLHAAVFPERPPWTAGAGPSSSAASRPRPSMPGGSARTLPRPPDAPAGRVDRRLAFASVALLSVVAGGLAAVWAFGRAPSRPTTSSGSGARPPTDGTPSPQCGPEMVAVAAGTFTMGSDDPSFDLWRPAHQVTLGAFCIDVFEATVADYRACSDRGECKRPDPVPDWPKRAGESDEQNQRARAAYAKLCNFGRPDAERHPVNCVDWTRAADYCRYRGKRLPTEAEWERAARGADGGSRPWGDQAIGPQLLNACGAECNEWEIAHRLPPSARMYGDGDGYAGTAPVGSFPLGRASSGAQDMFGNVWEWTADGFARYAAGPVGSPEARGGDSRVVRGGAFNAGAAVWVDPAYRWHQVATASSPAIGVRCARTP